MALAELLRFYNDIAVQYLALPLPWDILATKFKLKFRIRHLDSYHLADSVSETFEVPCSPDTTAYRHEFRQKPFPQPGVLFYSP